jgi:hypothetical protein
VSSTPHEVYRRRSSVALTDRGCVPTQR